MKQFYMKLKRTRNSSFLYIYIRKAKNCKKRNLKKIPKKVLTLYQNRYKMLIDGRDIMIKKKLHIDIDEEIKLKLDKISKERGMRTNELIRFILSEYLLKNGDK